MWKFAIRVLREINIVIIEAAGAAGVKGLCCYRAKSFLVSVKNEDGLVKAFIQLCGRRQITIKTAIGKQNLSSVVRE